MIDKAALARAKMMPEHATPPARMVGGDRALWDAEMEIWDGKTVLSNPRYKSAGEHWEASGEIEC